jgi:uncharacterized membrane protein YfcA
MIDMTTIEAVLPYVGVGFAAQTVDGALGMAFGIISNTLLVTLGVPPAAASAGVHTVETFTTAASGISHVLHKNVDWKLFGRLLIPGILGGLAGVYAVTAIPVAIIKPIILVYLISIGVMLLWRSRHMRVEERKPKVVEPLGLVGGFLDAAGGGGWGPVVTSNLMVQGVSPRITVGTVNTVEFFLTSTVSAAFIYALGWEAFTTATIGLLIGGLVAAPFGAILAKRVKAQTLMLLVGLVLTATSLWNLYRAVFA